MASDRAKPVLDERSFQGLLAAAFTIQQHNAAMREEQPDVTEGKPPRSVKGEPPKASAEPAVTCTKCGTFLPSTGAHCPTCGAASFRPGERLQRNWASLWQISQDKGVWPDARKKPEPAPLSPADPGRASSEPLAPPPAADARVIQPWPLQIEGAPVSAPMRNQAVLTERVENHNGDGVVPAEEPMGLAERVDTGAPTLAPLMKIEWPGEAKNETAHELALVDTTDAISHADEDWDSPASDEDGLAAAESAPKPLADEDQSKPVQRRLKVQFRRADLYLGLAVVIAFAALLWPTDGKPKQPQQPELAPWERILIAMGVAEAPQPVVHFHGDPNLKVWVDTHTALYYCPGDELYGKSPDGHYSTQREAQMDRFEPAERSVCIE